MKKRVIALLTGTALVMAGCSNSAPKTNETEVSESAEAVASSEEESVLSEEGESDLSDSGDSALEEDKEDEADESSGEVSSEPEEAAEAGETISSNELSNDFISVSIPQELAGTFEAEVTSDEIYIYDKECKEAGFGGLVGSIWTVKSPREYAGGPYMKVGELSNGDAEIYDVVQGFVTEMQWDYNAEEMPESYANLENAMESIIENMKGTEGYTFNYGAGMKGEDLYSVVLSKYVKAVKEDWDDEKLESEDMSSEFFYSLKYAEKDPLDIIGYKYADINVDGVDELLVGIDAEDEFKGVIYDVYTMKDHAPVHVVSGTARNRYYLYNGNFLCNEYSDSAFYWGWDLYIVEANSGNMIYQYGYKYDSNENEESPWFVSYDGGDAWESITEEEFKQHRSSDTEGYDRTDYTPLSENEDAIARVEG